MLFDLALPTWVDDWDLFHTELETNFIPFDLVGEAKAEIETLVMAEGSRSAIYFVEFNCLASCIQWDDHTLLWQAYKGLPHRIKNEMVHHDRPVTMLDLHKLVQAIDYRYWEREAEIMHKANLTSKVDPKGDLKVARNPEAMCKGKAPENLKPSLDLTGKLGKDSKLTSQEHQHHMDNSLCLFCGETGHITKDCLKPMAIAAQACTAVTELQEPFIEEAKKD